MKCAHPGCKCNVTTNTYGQYCSEHCKNAGDKTEPHCTCNHPDCR
jgi:hypothetical protein